MEKKAWIDLCCGPALKKKVVVLTDTSGKILILFFLVLKYLDLYTQFFKYLGLLFSWNHTRDLYVSF